MGLCTDTWTTGQTLPSGTTTVAAHFANTSAKACSIVLGLSVAGTSLGSATVSVAARQAATSPVTLGVATSAHTFTTGQQATLTLRGQSCGGCDKTTLYAGSSTYPTKVTLTA